MTERELDSDLLIKSHHLVYFRLAFAVVALVVGFFVWAAVQTELKPAVFFALAFFVTAYSLAGLFLLKIDRLQEPSKLTWMNSVLVACDFASLSALVHFTGGVDSDFYFLFLLPILLSSHAFSRRGVYLTALCSSVCYVAVLLAANWALFAPYIAGGEPAEGLAGAYVRRLATRVAAHGVILASMAFVWAAFCEHMSKIAQQRATRLRGQLDANNRLMAETRAQAAREQLINSISSAIRSTLELDQILSTTVTQLSSALNLSRCAIITPGAQPGDPPLIWEAIQSGQGPAHQTYFSQRFCQFVLERKSRYESNGVGGQVKKTFVFNEPLKDPLFNEMTEDLSKLGFRSLIVQPIMYGIESKGVLLIGECEQSRQWNTPELDLIKSVAAQVAIAIEHANLVELLSRKNRDLMHKTQNLDAKNLELRTMQSQLIHQEKMASLGRMVAGIAHELNNPVNFVHGNLPYLRQYFEDLKKVIASLERLSEEHRQKVRELKQSYKYDFLVADLDNILADLEEGAERIRTIIRNLRSFSRLDEAELKEASLQEGIESTLKILNQYYGRDKIPVETRFADVPPILCYPGKLNQVWMNLLSNAAEALVRTPEPRVSIATEMDGDFVIVSIGDNGPGVKTEDQSKIFEPFYTTKPVGQGTGLGLSICHSIIERHGGRIWFESPGEGGTTFKVRIPLKAEPVELDESIETAVSVE